MLALWKEYKRHQHIEAEPKLPAEPEETTTFTLYYWDGVDIEPIKIRFHFETDEWDRIGTSLQALLETGHDGA